MTQITGLQSSAYAAMGPLPAEVNGLSMDAMLAYCETRLRDIDQGVQAQMADQVVVMNRKKALNTVIAEAKKWDPPTVTNGGKPLVREAWNAAIESLPPDDPFRAEFKKLRDDTWSSCYQGDKMKSAERKAAWKDALATLETKAYDLGADSEMSMMKLQSVVSQRQTLVSLITNIMAKLQQGTEHIVNNIK